MKICISIGHGKSARGGYDSGATPKVGPNQIWDLK